MELINNLQAKMAENGYNAYIVPTGDYHASEYIADYFKDRQALTGFTGSAGTLVVTLDNAYLWVDGRYFIQAKNELEKKKIKIMKIGEKKTPSIIEFLAEQLTEDDVLAFDGRIVSASFVNELRSKLNGIKIVYDIDLVAKVYNRPKMPMSLLYEVTKYYSGKDYSKKLEEVHNQMIDKSVDMLILPTLDDIAWLLNLRANDIPNFPVFLSFVVLTLNQTILFIDETKIDTSVEKYLSSNNIIVKPYDSIYDYLRGTKNKKILVDLTKVNYRIYTLIQENQIVDETSPTQLMKCIKNGTEIRNIKAAHIKDGVAYTKTMYKFKKSYELKEKFTELTVIAEIEKFKKKHKNYISKSFNTICGYNEHAAIMHYSPTEETNAVIANGLLLLDCGGHYIGGTTDVTRTLAFGRLSDDMKVHYTTVLKSLIQLSRVTFLSGMTGKSLDVIARAPIWNLELDYQCGTGHGVGNVLSVHEGPNRFYWNNNSITKDQEILPGMITTNEPGIYLENQYGIRIENELLCVSKKTNEYGEFLGFETLTYIPIDTDAIKPSLLTKEEKAWLNEYHQMVRQTISEYLDPEEQDWLVEFTKDI